MFTCQRLVNCRDVGTRRALTVVRRLLDVPTGQPVKIVPRLQGEAGAHVGDHGDVLRPRQVVQPDRDPRHQVCVVRALPCGPTAGISQQQQQSGCVMSVHISISDQNKQECRAKQHVRWACLPAADHNACTRHVGSVRDQMSEIYQHTPATGDQALCRPRCRAAECHSDPFQSPCVALTPGLCCRANLGTRCVMVPPWRRGHHQGRSPGTRPAPRDGSRPGGRRRSGARCPCAGSRRSGTWTMPRRPEVGAPAAAAGGQCPLRHPRAMEKSKMTWYCGNPRLHVSSVHESCPPHLRAK